MSTTRILIDGLDTIGKLEGLYNWLSQPQENLIHEQFNMRTWNSTNYRNGAGFLRKTKEINGKVIDQCGTKGCMAGELPAISDEWSFHHSSLVYRGKPRGISDPNYYDQNESTIMDISRYFQIPYEDAVYLFANEMDAVSASTPTKDEMLKVLLNYINKLKSEKQ